MGAQRLIFLGPPGSGKGTQAARMSETFGLTALSSGDTLRREIADDSAVGRAAHAYVSTGQLVPDDVITDVMLAAIDRLPRSAGFILDGFPRTIPQAEALQQGLAARGIPLHGVVDFEIPDQEVVGRLAGRRVCTGCGMSYNVRSLPPRAAGVCDRCGAALAQREDDREDVVATRLATYRRQTAPLIDFYRRHGLLHPVDAAADVNDVESAVAAEIEAMGVAG
ncbi:MAG TPA: adenylate kinase [Phycisphaerae bacterium]|nr:adenylate kinase [Phycisphaerae bacterium]